MPSRNELNRYFGNTGITNALRRFPGGYYEIAKILDVQMKESETQFGRSGEELAIELLESHGFEVQRMSTRYAYDLYVNGSVKVDVKTARLSKTSGTAFYYSFNLEKRFPTCDIYFLIAKSEAGKNICEKYKAEKKDFEERKAFVYELNYSQSVYHRDYEDKHRERGKKRFLGSEFRGERG